jgi:hypothetical protein
MEEIEDGLVYLAAGLGAPILLGMALVPLRGLSTASNFTFVFIVLTIVVAGYGGRWAAVASALSSALSLDFFLTQPYGKLTIDDKHDVIAFAGLTVCGLTAAALGSRRPAWTGARRDAGAHLDLLHLAIAQAGLTGPAGPRLSRVLESCADVLQLEAAVVRDDRGNIVASSGRGAEMRPVPEQRLDPETLLPGADAGRGGRSALLTGRLALLHAGQTIGWLDLWADAAPDAPARRTLGAMARVTALLLAGASGRSGPGH